MNIRTITTITFFAFTLAIYSQTPTVEENKPATSKKFPFNGMGRVILKSADINTTRQPYLTQADFTSANTVYVICYDYRLASDIVIPEGCVLQFDGGSISGKYKITGTNTGINAPLVTIFGTDISLAGIWNVREAYPEWFGAKGDGESDDADAIQKTFELRCPVYLQSKVYGVGKPIYLPESSTLLSCVSELNVNPHALSFSTNNYTSQRGCLKSLSQIDEILNIDGISVTLKNIAIDGNSKKADCGIGQDRTRYKSRVVIDNCYVYDCKYGISTALYLSEIVNNTCHQCDVGFHNESSKGATMTSLTITRNYAKNCSIGYKLVGLIYSNLLNNACDKCTTGVIVRRVRCCNMLSNGFEMVDNLYVLSDYCDALEFNGVYGVMKDGSTAFSTEDSFFGDFAVKNFKMLHFDKIKSLIDITGNTEPTKHCVVHVDRSINKFLCKGKGNYIIVETEKNMLDGISFTPYKENTEPLYPSGHSRVTKTHLFNIANGAYFIEGFKTAKGSNTRMIYEIAEVTLEPGDYLFGGFITSDENIREGITCVISENSFTNNTIISTRHNVGSFKIDKRKTVHMSIYIRGVEDVPNMIIAPYITKVN